jgi:hypothetical protein
MSGRKVALFGVMCGALALTVNGEVRAVAPMLGTGFGVVLAGVFALSTLLALNYVIEGSGRVRFWAWMVLLLAGGMELGLNTWHALTATIIVDGVERPALPTTAAVAVGAGPVVLAALLSHLVALTMSSAASPAAPAGAHVEAQSVPSPVPSVPAVPVHPVPVDAGTPEPVRVIEAVKPVRKNGAAVRRTVPKTVRPVRPDEELLAILSYPELVARDPDGTVPVRRAARELGCGVDRARKLLRDTGLLSPDRSPLEDRADIDRAVVEV